MEAAISKALTELVGIDINAQIGAVEFAADRVGMPAAIKFSVSAEQRLAPFTGWDEKAT